MRVGLFGGSFDPIHQGHIEPVLQAVETVPLDRVLYLPTADPPHKRDRGMAPAHARYTMVELALLDFEALRASDHELTPGRVAYTVETVLHFQREFPEDELFLLLGADSFCHLHRWRRWQELVAAVDLVVLRRPGWSLRGLPEDGPTELLNLLASPRTHIVESASEPSSTEVRELLDAGQRAPAELLPPPVLRYIEKYGLYGLES